MPQTLAIVQTLKALLKNRGYTYRDVSKALELSEASVKRLFAEQSFSLQRLDQVCQLLDIEITDLIKQMESRQQHLDELSEEQELELVADNRLLLVAFLVINGWGYDDILSRYALKDTELIRYLARLDRIRMIELQANNRIRLRISPTFSWRRNGPIQKFFSQYLQDDFLKSRFEDAQETLQFPSGMLSAASCEQLNRRIKQLVQDFHNLNQQDRNLPLQNKNGYSLFIAFRPWRPDIFQQLLKTE